MRRRAINRPGASRTTLRSASSRGIRRSRTSLHAASSRTVAEFWISAADRGSWRHCSRRRVIVAVIGLRACRCHPIRSHTAGSTSRRRSIERAKHAVDGTAHFVCADIRSVPFDAADTVILLDVLHYLDYRAQEHLLRRVCDAMKAGGRMLLRVADESSTLRFRCTVAIDRVLMTLRGQRIDRLYCRPVAAWIRMLEAHGFHVTATPMSAGTPFANVLLCARYDAERGNEASPALRVHDDELPGSRSRTHARCFSRGIERACSAAGSRQSTSTPASARSRASMT